MVSNPLAAERAVEAAENAHDETQIKAAKAIRRRTYLLEAALILAAYFVYGWVRGLVEGHTGDAIHRAQQLVRLERSLHIYHEKAINHFVAHQHWLAYICDYWYAIMHFLVTIWVGVWIYWKHPEWARQLRTAWYSMNVVAIFGFAFLPLAPPRLLPGGGFIDTVVKFHTWGSWGSKSVSKDANLYAAMPSMHIGWSLWVAIAVVLLARRTWVCCARRPVPTGDAVRDRRHRQPLLHGRGRRGRRVPGRHPDRAADHEATSASASASGEAALGLRELADRDRDRPGSLRLHVGPLPLLAQRAVVDAKPARPMQL